MIVNLHSKDASITKIGDGVYNFTWNLNGIIHDRFSARTRVYIQDFNLCELYDNISKNYINGSFQLRSNIVNGKEIIDSDRSSIGQNVIFTGNLTSYKNFVNTNPMFMYNYKLNDSAFNTGYLSFTLHLFDETGSDFTVWQTTEYTLDETDSAFTTYNDKKNQLNSTKELLSDTKDIIEDAQQKRQIALTAFKAVERDLLRAKQDLLTALTSRLGDTLWKGLFLTKSETIEEATERHQEIYDIISKDNIDDILDLFNSSNFVNGFPYYTGNASRIRPKYNYLKQTAIPNYVNTLLDANQLATEIYNFQNSTDFFIRHNQIEDDSVFRTDDEKLPQTDKYFKSTSGFKSYNYVVNYETNTKQATGVIFMKLKNYYDNKFNITVEKLIPNSNANDDLLAIPDAELTFYIAGFDDLESTTTTDLLTFTIQKEHLIKNSLLVLQNLVISRTSALTTARASVPTIATERTISIDDNIKSKLPNINMSMVLYEEEDEPEPIKGTEIKNTITKSYLPQYRRI